MKIPTSKRLKIIELGKNAFFENMDVLDYIWKSKNLIEHEWKVEVEKGYFKSNPEMAKARWEREFRKIYRIFPTLINNSNLVMALSLHEARFLLLCKLVDPHSKTKLREYKGIGMNRYLTYLKREFGLVYEKEESWELTHSALTIRNCITHTFGILEHSRDEKEIRQILKSRKYLPRENRNGEILSDEEVKIIKKKVIGEQIMLGSHYPWLVSSHVLELFIFSCEHLAGHKVIRYVDENGDEVDPKKMGK